MVHGSVKWFDDNKGYGFVVTDEDPDTDVFVHYSVIEQTGFKSLREGQRVQFVIEQGPKGRFAAHVEKLEAARLVA